MRLQELKTWGEPLSPTVFWLMTEARDDQLTESLARRLKEQTGREDWCLIAVPVEDWDQDLTPWPAPPVFGDRGFGDGAPAALARLEKELLPEWEARYPMPDRRAILCGYSLAGLFALWAGTRTSRFAGVAGCSPSVWYPGWLDYAREHPMRAGEVYLSLGDREEKTRNPVMATVGEAIRTQEELLRAQGVPCRLDWNPGNHFAQVDLRLARGMAWFLRG